MHRKAALAGRVPGRLTADVGHSSVAPLQPGTDEIETAPRPPRADPDSRRRRSADKMLLSAGVRLTPPRSQLPLSLAREWNGRWGTTIPKLQVKDVNLYVAGLSLKRVDISRYVASMFEIVHKRKRFQLSRLLRNENISFSQ